jgi:hypothetical protein
MRRLVEICFCKKFWKIGGVLEAGYHLGRQLAGVPLPVIPPSTFHVKPSS